MLIDYARVSGAASRRHAAGVEARSAGLGRDLRHLVKLIHELTSKGVGLKLLAEQGAQVDTTTLAGKLVFGIFSALAEFERELTVEHRRAGLAAAPARGRAGGRPAKMTWAKLRLAQAVLCNPGTQMAELCREVNLSRQTLYRHVAPDGTFRADGETLLQ